jgi:hypothetical protein
MEDQVKLQMEKSAKLIFGICMPQSGISEKLVRFCSPWSLDDMQMQMAQN